MNVFEFLGRIEAVFFESIIYEQPVDMPIEPEDWDRVLNNIQFNEDRGYTNIESEYIGVIEGYHTWKLTGYNANGDFRTWNIIGVNKYEQPKALVQESIDSLISIVEDVTDIDWWKGQHELQPVSRYGLSKILREKAKEHGLL